MSFVLARNAKAPRLDHASAVSAGEPVGWMPGRWAIEVGDQIVLPILETLDGAAVDLEALADRRAVVLIFDPGLPDDRSEATVRAYMKVNSFLNAAGASLIVVTPEGLDSALASDSNAASLPLAVDVDHRFAHTLGLVLGAPYGERMAAATYVVDDMGKVIYAHVEPDRNAKTKIAALVPALMALRASESARGIAPHA